MISELTMSLDDDYILSDQCRRCAAFVFPDRWKYFSGFVVASQAMNSRLDQNQTKLWITVLPVSLEMLANGDSLLDEEVEILWDVRRESLGLEDAQDLVTRHKADLGDTMRVTQNDTNLRWCQALLGQLVNLLLYIIRSQLQPSWDASSVRQWRLRNTLSAKQWSQNIKITKQRNAIQGITS